MNTLLHIVSRLKKFVKLYLHSPITLRDVVLRHTDNHILLFKSMQYPRFLGTKSGQPYVHSLGPKHTKGYMNISLQN
jgi:hypothetical protein